MLGIFLEPNGDLKKFIYQYKKKINNKYLDTNRISTDVKLLKAFYQNRGYYNVKIKSSYGTVQDNKSFKLIFSIDAGEKFYFNEFSLNISDAVILKQEIDQKNKRFDSFKFKNQINETLSDNVLSYENIPASKVLLLSLIHI